MNNAFLTELFDWAQRDRQGLIGVVNTVLHRLNIPWVISRAPDPTRDMTNLLQRHNLWHLAMQTLAANVPGDFVDLGCFDGKTSVIFARTLKALAPDRQLHVYDHFAMGFHLTGQNIQEQLSKNFDSAGVLQPQIHAGDFRETIPRQLPEKIAFAHVDCGFGGDAQAHQMILVYLLNHLYPRLEKGAICVLADFHDSLVSDGPDYNPGVSLAVQTFFADKPETVNVLLANEYTHGYFRKL